MYAKNRYCKFTSATTLKIWPELSGHIESKIHYLIKHNRTHIILYNKPYLSNYIGIEQLFIKKMGFGSKLNKYICLFVSMYLFVT